MYDDELPYSFHLRLVVKIAKDFKSLGEKLCDAYYDKSKEWYQNLSFSALVGACWLHDTIEDVRVNYNDILKIYNDNIKGEKVDRRVAEIVRAVTNVTRGRTREERMPDEVYNDIRNTPGATFVKLCDRIANVQYSKMMGSSMFEKYKKENANFLNKLDGFELQFLQPMVERLNLIFENNV